MFELYSTDGCHLCDMAFEQVQQLAATEQVNVVDIVDNDVLVVDYGIRIPVIKHMSSGDELGWPFDVQQLASFMSRHK
jgi:thiol-disulfide isomerase/thioredoxin